MARVLELLIILLVSSAVLNLRVAISLRVVRQINGESRFSAKNKKNKIKLR